MLTCAAPAHTLAPRLTLVHLSARAALCGGIFFAPGTAALMGRHKLPAALFIGGSALIFTTFVFVAPAMPRLDFPPLLRGTLDDSLTTEHHRTSDDMNTAQRGTRIELGPLDHARVQHVEAVKVAENKLASASNITDALPGRVLTVCS